MRQDSTNEIKVLPATAEHWADIEDFFAGQACWCQYWRMSASEYGRYAKGPAWEKQVQLRRERLRHQVYDSPPPGMLAYLDQQMVGWCGFGLRQNMQRLERSRTIPKVDDRLVWSIVCFFIRPGFRRRGIARRLLQAVVKYAQHSGIAGLEAYPVEHQGKRINANSAYVGTVSMFQAEGFRKVTESDARTAGLARWVMRLDF